MYTCRFSLLASAIFAIFFLSEANAKQLEKPKLVLEIVVDQLRGDMPDMVYDRLGSKGFRYLTKKGTWYKNAHHPHANTETIVGHVTLATGTYPSVHGMVGNVWFDNELDRLVYNIEDPDYEATGGMSGRDSDIEVDMSQVAKTEGRSPKTIITSTFSDELSISYGSQAKIFAVSGKDRSAVAMAGHFGKAFWYSTKNGQISSSTYYYDVFPDWVHRWNQQKKADNYYGKSWQLIHPIESYNKGAQDNRPFENPPDLGYGKVFPHPFGDKDNKYFYTMLMTSPVVDELTVDFAKELIKSENIGQDDVPDYLSISLSSTDYVGHLFGPASLESEDNLLRLDQTLADLLSFIDQTIGLKSTLIVLSADHGSPEAPEYLADKGMPVSRLNLDELDLSSLDAQLKKRFGFGKEVIKKIYHPYVYLDRELIKKENKTLDVVSSLIAEEMSKIDGISTAIATTDIVSGHLPSSSPLIQQIERNYNPKRSGDIHLVYEPHWGITAKGDYALVNHGSPWGYDTYVPIIFSGWRIPSAQVYRKVETVDIASTLALLLGTKLPSGSVGKPLKEVFD